MKNYKHLTREKRYQIYALLDAGLTQREMGERLEVSASTISRELRRNRQTDGSYQPTGADRQARGRRRGRSRWRAWTWTRIQEKLRLEWSPEQIAAWLMRRRVSVSAEGIYQRILKDGRAGGTLHRHLRHRRRQRRRRFRDERKVGPIQNRIGIEQRPAQVQLRRRAEHWEVDSVLGRQGQLPALLTAVERKTGYTLIAKVERKTAACTAQAMIQILKPYRARVRTITADNGSEFAGHQAIAAALDADFYFSHPHSPWERGTNENTNGLIRQYFPKGCDLSVVTRKQVQHVMDRLNHRPRKRLGFKTPHQLFFQSLRRSNITCA